MIERARRSYLEASKQPVDNVQYSQQPFLRSMTEPTQNKKRTCFFCDGEEDSETKLYQVTFNKKEGNKGGADLKKSIERKNEDIYKVKLSEALDPKDALAIDVMYHPSSCRDNVDHVLRTKDSPMTQESSKFAAEFSAKIESFTLLRGLLDDGHKVSIGDVQKGYERIRLEK